MDILEFYPNKRKSGIYIILNVITNKVYVGSTIGQLEKRRNVHFHLLRKKKHENKKLQNSWNKYGEENFQFHIIEICSNTCIIEREQYWIDFYNSVDKGYNIFPFARSGAGIKLTDGHRRKLSESHKGNKHKEETKKKMSISHIGRKKTIETKQNIAKAKNGTNNPMSKLTELDVLAIREEYSLNGTIKAQAIKYKVSTSTIEGIVYGKTWKHFMK